MSIMCTQILHVLSMPDLQLQTGNATEAGGASEDGSRVGREEKGNRA